MKFVVVFAALFAVALAAPVDDAKTAQVLRYDNDNIGVDGYKFGFETSDGKTADEEGHLENVGTDDEAIAVHGSFRYVGDDGVTYEVTYTAGKDGFRPEGSHIPKDQH